MLVWGLFFRGAGFCRTTTVRRFDVVLNGGAEDSGRVYSITSGRGVANTGVFSWKVLFMGFL